MSSLPPNSTFGTISLTGSCCCSGTKSCPTICDPMEKTLMLGKIVGRERRGRQRIRCFDGITDSIDMSLSNLWEMVKDREAWHAAVHGWQSETRLSY